MALLFMDGFDHMGTSDTILLTKWASGAGAEAPSTLAARTGTHGLSMGSGASTLISKALAASGGFVVGFAARAPSSWGTADLLQVREGTTAHLGVGLDGSGHLTVLRGATVLATGTTVLAVNTWYYLEFKGTIHDSTGAYDLRIDGVTELSASGVDTRNGGSTGQWDRLYLGGQRHIDDLYVCDQSGAAPTNTFLGPVKIELLLPQTDAVAAGSNAGLTPSTGTDHGAMVDETPPNTTDYNSGATVGLKDTYNYPSLSLTGTILGVQTNLYVQKSDAGARSVCAVVRSGGTDYDGSNVSPGTSFGYVSEVRALDPATSAAWTSSGVNALQAGMKVTV